MKKNTKRAAAPVRRMRASVVLSSLVLTAMMGLTGAPATVHAQTAQSSPDGDQAQQIKQGAYLARVGDCIACHTAKGGKSFAGGLPMATPIGTIYSSNITPDKINGIGTYTLEDFDRAVRHGVAKNGNTLYPAMPYPSYAKVKPADIKALYAYFMNGVAPVAQANKAPDIPWPMSMRWPLAAWRKLYAPDVVTEDTPIQDADPVARGRYLVEGLAHCSACHTPRKVTMQESALTDDGSMFLSGAVIDGYLAKNLRGDVNDGLGKWTEADIVSFLKGGRNAHSAAFGGMAEVVENSTQFMTDDDLGAIATYLKTLKAVHPDQVPLVYNNATEQMFHNGQASSNGAIQFLNNCAACHRTNGLGWKETFPALALSTTVNTQDPTSLIHIVLAGAEMPWTTSAPTHYAMPAFASRLDDRDIAELLTFVRSGWGNDAPAVTPDMVAKVRQTLPATPTEAAQKRVSPVAKH
ncbi:cytochrome c [Robbsia andropogonis]|nr:cytochrome c [Robbsia andropogonis]MCP1119564.1 cytochrome c [Robbsia andropogonis]MCP1129547.1 cytochrome c [Robbsia andropogonis]